MRWVANPAWVTVTVYTPEGRSLKEKRPALVLAVLRVKPVLAWSTFTVASVTIAPLWSYTVPEMVPREVWAKTDAANNRTILSKKEERRDGTILHLLEGTTKQ
jgi:hypothetical protein